MFKQIAMCRDTDLEKVTQAVNAFLVKHPGDTKVTITFDNTNACVAMIEWSMPIRINEEAEKSEEAPAQETNG